MRRWRLAVGLAAVAAALFSAAPGRSADAQEGDGRRALVATLAGTITPVTAGYVSDGIERAEDGGYAAFVLRLDTPGGLESSMRDIVQDVLGASVPVLVYVSPDGARAASAGAIIALSAHVAAMAPGTALGAATPVTLEGGDAPRKAVNDAAAYAESIARLRQRNVEFAVATVREGRSVPADEAVAIGAVDLVAPDLAALLEQADGRPVRLAPGGREAVLEVAGAAVEEYDFGLLRRIQQLLAQPDLAYLLLSLGSLALVTELASPGGVAGVVGVILIGLGLFSVSVLPADVVGLALMALAAVLFVVEVLAPGVGLAAVGGAAALALAGVFLFDDVPGFEVSAVTIVPVALVTAAGAFLAGRVARAVRGTPAQSGAELYEGRVVTVAKADEERGWAFVEGAWWRLRPAGGRRLELGEPVRVIEVDGLELVVEATAGHESKGQP